MFFERLREFGQAPALVDETGPLSYLDLYQSSQKWARRLGSERQLVVFYFANKRQDVCFYLACLQAGHVAIILDPASEHLSAAIVDAYQPNWIYRNGQLRPMRQQSHTLAPSLRILMSTSGSTGNAKQVALSDNNLSSNAEAIATSLGIESTDIALSTLPFHYVYGLSVLNSHLHTGACVRLFDDSVTSRQFWQLLKNEKISSIAGVPFQYECLSKLRFLQRDYPHLRYMTQAGGRLRVDLVCAFAKWAQQHNKRFYVMYGQTEATARMAVNANPLHKPDAIGKAIPGGTFSLRDPKDNLIDKEGEVGELMYSGENVFCGYVKDVADLAEVHAQRMLATGDLAKRDAQGDYYILGRISRFIKLFGKRLNLADIEASLEREAIQAYALMADEQLKLVCVNADKDKVEQHLRDQFNIHPGYITIKVRDTIPLTASGKPDYPALQAWFDND